ncbi:sensor histidine kinase [Actinoplanes teichomyceticus]|uniref:Anti-sigma regulatory factor (Ser/Thr protein kinase) n=1 Tax=Actinoplanes teichomyceticus TaxID=1867 RepID=A0A561VCS2_ACTTI|nr:sensor histidine kinase [Actinoplanes teichomyceticus]TWG09412.1 anti-sigma regulatory factor (Ser/Thr protein kinase) [Actinoplanes teichomyceticus]GIF17005.1 hypothetical protein Ate01nite_70370 [Actinoplanes teichomyceticus]
MVTTVPDTTGFIHAALVVSDDADLRAVLAPELRRSAAAYDEVLLVVGDRTRALLTERDPGVATAVSWADPGAFYQRLGSAYDRFRRYLADRHRAGQRVHVIAEPAVAGDVCPGSGADRAAAYLAYESVCNETYAFGPSAVTCVWDSRRHRDSVIDSVRDAHPHVLTASGPAPWPHYLPPERYLAERPEPPMPPPPAQVAHDITLHDVADLSAVRSVLGVWAGTHGFGTEATEDILVAVIEVATNGLRHGGAPVRLRAWAHADTLVAQCDDAGSGAIPAAAGYHRPDPLASVAGGRGLWLARQLADVVTVSARPGCTSVRLYFPRHIMQP